MDSSVNSMSAVLNQMQSMAGQAAGGKMVGGAGALGSAAGASGDFASMLKSSIDQVSHSQTSALSEAHAFEMGAPNVGLNDVMVDMQKANINFQMAVQVRNKLVSAYSDIMQMSV